MFARAHIPRVNHVPCCGGILKSFSELATPHKARRIIVWYWRWTSAHAGIKSLTASDGLKLTDIYQRQTQKHIGLPVFRGIQTGYFLFGCPEPCSDMADALLLNDASNAARVPSCAAAKAADLCVRAEFIKACPVSCAGCAGVRRLSDVWRISARANQSSWSRCQGDGSDLMLALGAGRFSYANNPSKMVELFISPLSTFQNCSSTLPDLSPLLIRTGSPPPSRALLPLDVSCLLAALQFIPMKAIAIPILESPVHLLSNLNVDDDLVISGCGAEIQAEGFGIIVAARAVLHVDNVTIAGARSVSALTVKGSAILSRVRFLQNEVSCRQTDAACTQDTSRVKDRWGGAVLVDQQGALQADGCKFVANVGFHAGAMYVSPGGEALVYDSHFEDNYGPV